MEFFHQEILQKVSEVSPVYLVGGTVRDTLLKRPTKDLDGVIAISIDELEMHLKEWGYNPLRIGAQHLTLSVFQKGERIDFNPFQGDFYQDALRRDFTINAIYQDFRTGEYLDPLGGLKDLEKKILKACGDPEARFSEDPIRILRLIRFCVKYGFEIEQDTLAAAKNLIRALRDTAPERISEELGHILTLDNPEASIRLLDEMGYLQAFLPELTRLKGLVQNRYHSKDAWEHTLHVFRNTPSRLILRLAGLFHDLGKWETASRECYAWGKCRPEKNGIKLEEYRLVGRPLQRWIGQFVEVHGARLDHYPEVIQVKHIRKANTEKVGFEWVKDGKRHFLGHERESRRLTGEILPRFRFSMVLGKEGGGGEKELLWLIENHMAGTLMFLAEIRDEGKSRQLSEKARRFAWEYGWDGRKYCKERLNNLLKLWRADFYGGKQREPKEEEVFERIQEGIKEEIEEIGTRLQKIAWGVLEKFAKERGISGRKFGDFKEYVRARLMNNPDFLELNVGFLEKEYNRFSNRAPSFKK